MSKLAKRLLIASIALVGLVSLWRFYRHVTRPAVSVTSYGAAGQVSGSLHVLQAGSSTGFIDCGNFYPEGSGSYARRLSRANRMSSELPVSASAVDYVILTHAHLDHMGRIPLLVKKGFKGRIYVTPGTARLMSPMIKSAVRYSPLKRKWVYSHYRLENSRSGKRTLVVHWNNCRYCKRITRKGHFRGTFNEMEDKMNLRLSPCRVCANMERDKIMETVKIVPFGKKFHPAPGITAEFIPNGHIPGSAAVLITITHNGQTKKLLFSGDTGKEHDILQRPAVVFPPADYVWLESTYGGTVRRQAPDAYARFARQVENELAQGHVVWIPAFALDRTQKVMHTLARYGHIEVPMYVTSPLANLFNRYYIQEYRGRKYGWFNEKVYTAPRMFPSYAHHLPKDTFKTHRPAILFTTSGMMDSGMSVSLLGKLLPRSDVSVFLVGYQDPDTPGGQLKKGKHKVYWKGKTYPVRARVYSYGFFSAHADMKDALYLLSRQNKKHVHIYLIHGDPESLKERKNKLTDKGFRHVSISRKGKEIIIFN